MLFRGGECFGCIQLGIRHCLNGFSCMFEQQTLEALLESGYSLLKEQQLIMETKLSKEYMKNIDD